MKRLLPIIVVISQVITSNKSFGYVAANDEECVAIVSPALAWKSRFDKSELAEDERREIIDRLKSYFRWSSPPFRNLPVYTSEGIGEVFVSGDDITADGVTEIEGAVPISGSVSFGGPVRASGTVTIAGRCAPASGFHSPLLIPPPLRPVPSLPPILASPPIVSAPVIAAPIVDTPVAEPPPTLIPVTLPPVIIPAIVIPAYVIPEAVMPAPEVEIGAGCGEIFVTGNDIVVSGATYVDGVIPALGEVTFGGYVPAKGTVTICGCF